MQSFAAQHWWSCGCLVPTAAVGPVSACQSVCLSVWGMEQQQPLLPAGTKGCKDRQPSLTADIVQTKLMTEVLIAEIKYPPSTHVALKASRAYLGAWNHRDFP